MERGGAAPLLTWGKSTLGTLLGDDEDTISRAPVELLYAAPVRERLPTGTATRRADDIDPVARALKAAAAAGMPSAAESLGPGSGVAAGAPADTRMTDQVIDAFSATLPFAMELDGVAGAATGTGSSAASLGLHPIRRVPASGQRSALDGIPTPLQRVYDPARPRSRTVAGMQLMALYKATHPTDDADFAQAARTVAKVRQQAVASAREARAASAAMVMGGQEEGKSSHSWRHARRPMSSAATSNPSAIRDYPNAANAVPLRRAGEEAYGSSSTRGAGPGTHPGGDLLAKGNAGVPLNAAHPAHHFVHVRMANSDTGGTLTKEAASYLAGAASEVERRAVQRSGSAGPVRVRVRPPSGRVDTLRSGGRGARLAVAVSNQGSAPEEQDEHDWGVESATPRRPTSAQAPSHSRSMAAEVGIPDPEEHQVVYGVTPVAYTAAVAHVVGVPAPGVRARVLDQVTEEVHKASSRRAASQGGARPPKPIRFSEADPTAPPPFSARHMRGMRSGTAASMRVKTVAAVASQIPHSLRIAVHGVDAGVESNEAARAKAAARSGGGIGRSVEQGALGAKATQGASRIAASLSAGIPLPTSIIDAASGTSGGSHGGAHGNPGGAASAGNGSSSDRAFVPRLANVSGHTDLITHVAFCPREFATGFAYDRFFTLSRDGVCCVWTVGGKAGGGLGTGDTPGASSDGASGVVNRLAFRVSPHTVTAMTFLLASQLLVVATVSREVLFFEFNAQTGDAKLKACLGGKHLSQHMPVSLESFVMWASGDRNARSEYGFTLGYALGNIKATSSGQPSAESHSARKRGRNTQRGAALVAGLSDGVEEARQHHKDSGRWSLPDGDEVLLVGDDEGGVTVVHLKRGAWHMGLRMARMTDSVWSSDLARREGSNAPAPGAGEGSTVSSGADGVAGGGVGRGMAFISAAQKQAAVRKRLRSALKWSLSATASKVEGSKATSARHRVDASSLEGEAGAGPGQLASTDSADADADQADGKETGSPSGATKERVRVYEEHFEGVSIWRFLAHSNGGWVRHVRFIPDLAAVVTASENGHVRIWRMSALAETPQTISQYQQYLSMLQESSKMAAQLRDEGRGRAGKSPAITSTMAGGVVVPTVATVYPSSRVQGVAMALLAEFVVYKSGAVSPVPAKATNATSGEHGGDIVNERPDKLVERILQQHARVQSASAMTAIRAAAGADGMGTGTAAHSRARKGPAAASRVDCGVRGAGAVGGSSEGGLVEVIEGTPLADISWSPTVGAFAVAGAGERWVCVFNPFSQSKVANLPTHSAPVTAVKFLDVASQLVVLSKDATLRIWNTRNFRASVSFSDPRLTAPTQVLASRWAAPLGVHPRTQALLTFTKVLTVWPLRALPAAAGALGGSGRTGAAGLGAVVAATAAGRGPGGSSDGAALITGMAYNGTFHELVSLERSDVRRAVVWDVLTGNHVHHIVSPHGETGVTVAAFDADQRRLVTGANKGDFLRVWNFHDGNLLREHALPPPPVGPYASALEAARASSRQVAPSGNAPIQLPDSVPWAGSVFTPADIVGVLAIKRVSLSGASAVGAVGVNGRGGGMQVSRLLVTATSDGRIYIYRDEGAGSHGQEVDDDAIVSEAAAQASAAATAPSSAAATGRQVVMDPLLTKTSRHAVSASNKRQDALSDLDAALAEAAGDDAPPDGLRKARAAASTSHLAASAMLQRDMDAPGAPQALMASVARHGAGLRLRIRSSSTSAVQRAKALAFRSSITGRLRSEARGAGSFEVGQGDDDDDAEESGAASASLALATKQKAKAAATAGDAWRGGAKPAAGRSMDEHLLKADGLPPATLPMTVAPCAADFASGRAHVDAVTGITFVPPHFAATCGADGNVILWSLATGRFVRTVYRGHASRTTAMKQATARQMGADPGDEDDRHAWLVAKRRALRLAGMDTAAVFPASELEALVRQRTGFEGKAFLEGDSNVETNLNARYDSLATPPSLDVATGLLGAMPAAMECVAYLPKLAALAAGGEDPLLRVWLTADPRHWQEYSPGTPRGESLVRLAVDEASDTLAVGDTAGWVSVWDVVPSPVAGAAWSAERSADPKHGSSATLPAGGMALPQASAATLMGDGERQFGPCGIPGQLRLLARWQAHRRSATVARDAFTAISSTDAAASKPRIASLAFVDSPLLMDAFLATAAAASAVKLWTLGGQLVGVFGHAHLGTWDLRDPGTFYYVKEARALHRRLQRKLDAIVSRKAAKAAKGKQARDESSKMPDDDEMRLLRQQSWCLEVAHGTSTLRELQQSAMADTERRAAQLAGTPAGTAAENALARMREAPPTLPLDQDVFPSFATAVAQRAAFVGEGGPLPDAGAGVALPLLPPMSGEMSQLPKPPGLAPGEGGAPRSQDASTGSLAHATQSASLPLPQPGQVWVQVVVEGGIKARNAARERMARTGALEGDESSVSAGGHWQGSLDLRKVTAIMTVERITKDAVIGWDGSPAPLWMAQAGAAAKEQHVDSPQRRKHNRTGTPAHRRFVAASKAVALVGGRGGRKRITVLEGGATGGPGLGRRRIMVPLQEFVSPDVRDGHPWIMHAALSQRVGRIFTPSPRDMKVAASAAVAEAERLVDGRVSEGSYRRPSLRSPTASPVRASSPAESVTSSGTASPKRAGSSLRKARSLRHAASGRWMGGSARTADMAADLAPEEAAARAQKVAVDAASQSIEDLPSGLRKHADMWGCALFAANAEEGVPGGGVVSDPSGAGVMAAPFKVMAVFLDVAHTEHTVTSVGAGQDGEGFKPGRLKYVLELKVRDVAGRVHECPRLPQSPAEVVMPYSAKSYHVDAKMGMSSGARRGKDVATHSVFPAPSAVSAALHFGMLQSVPEILVPPEEESHLTQWQLATKADAAPGWLSVAGPSLPPRHAHAYDVFVAPSLTRRGLSLFRRDAAVAVKTWRWCQAREGAPAVAGLWAPALEAAMHAGVAVAAGRHSAAQLQGQQSALFRVATLQSASSVQLFMDGSFPRPSFSDASEEERDATAAHTEEDSTRHLSLPLQGPVQGKDLPRGLVRAPFSQRSSRTTVGEPCAAGDEPAAQQGEGGQLRPRTSLNVFGGNASEESRAPSGTSRAAAPASVPGLGRDSSTSLSGVLYGHSAQDYVAAGDSPRSRALRRRARAKMGIRPSVNDPTVARQVSAAMGLLEAHNAREQSKYEAEVKVAREQAARAEEAQDQEGASDLQALGAAAQHAPAALSLAGGGSVGVSAFSVNSKKDGSPEDEATGLSDAPSVHTLHSTDVASTAGQRLSATADGAAEPHSITSARRAALERSPALARVLGGDVEARAQAVFDTYSFLRRTIAASSAASRAQAAAAAQGDPEGDGSAGRPATAPGDVHAGRDELLHAQVPVGFGSKVLKPTKFGWDPAKHEHVPSGPGIRRRYAAEGQGAAADGADDDDRMHPVIAKFSTPPKSASSKRRSAKAGTDAAAPEGLQRKHTGPAAAAARARAARRRRFGAKRAGLPSSSATSDARQARQQERELASRMRREALSTDVVHDVPLHASTAGVLRQSRVPPSLSETTPAGLRKYLPEHLGMVDQPVPMHSIPAEGHHLVPRGSTKEERIALLFPEFRADYREAVSMLPTHSGGEAAQRLEKALTGGAPHEALRPNVMDEMDDSSALGVAEYVRARLLESPRSSIAAHSAGSSHDSGSGRLSPSNAHRSRK